MKLFAKVTPKGLHVRLVLEGRERNYRAKRARAPGTWDRSHDQDALRELVDGDEQLASDVDDLEHALMCVSDTLEDRAKAGGYA